MRNTLKRNDGYVLPYVLIVFLVLSFAAVSICSISLKNLHAQEASIARTQALYEAEGKLEKVVAQISAQTASGEGISADAASNSAHSNYWGAINSFVSALDGTTITDDGNWTVVTVQMDDNETPVTVEAKLQVVPKASTTGEQVSFACRIDGAQVEYVSYNISHSTAEGGDGT